MLEVGQKYLSVKTQRTREVTAISETRKRIATTSTAVDGDSFECTQIIDRFIAGIGTDFILVEVVAVEGVKGEAYYLIETDELDGLNYLKRGMVESGHEERLYIMQRVVTGRKKPHTIRALRSVKTGQFSKALN